MKDQNTTVSGSNSRTDLIDDIKSELGLASSKRATMMVRKVFCGLVRSLSAVEMKILVTKLPDYLARLIPGEPDVSTHSYDHLDQWVENMSLEDQLSPERVFYSEINILRTLVVTINKLDKLCGLLKFSCFKYSLIRELKEASIQM